MEVAVAALGFGVLVPAVVAGLGTGPLRRWLHRRRIFCVPNERSSHAEPIPRGGGLSVVPAVLLAWVGVGAVAPLPAYLWAAMAAACVLMVISWMDDRRGLTPWTRLAAQVACATPVVWLLPETLHLVPWCPLPLERGVLLLALVWFVNLTNFMDGIDGISGAQMTAVGLGVTLLLLHDGFIPELGLGLGLAVAGLGFLRWNWHPARIFLGDVGSVPLGLLTAALLLWLAHQGHIIAAIILPAYFVADATLTLFKRLFRGERVWRAHREHFYQLAVRRGARHDHVVLRVSALNGVLILLALWTAMVPTWTAAIFAFGLVTGLLLHLGRWPAAARASR